MLNLTIKLKHNIIILRSVDNLDNDLFYELGAWMLTTSISLRHIEAFGFFVYSS